VKNIGTQSSTVDGVKVDLQLTSGTIENWTATESIAGEFLCGATNSRDSEVLEPCSQRRADFFRIKPRMLVPGQSIQLQLALNAVTEKVAVRIEMETDTGRSFQDRRVVQIESR
jgi:hypothetical protein